MRFGTFDRPRRMRLRSFGAAERPSSAAIPSGKHCIELPGMQGHYEGMNDCYLTVNFRL